MAGVPISHVRTSHVRFRYHRGLKRSWYVHSFTFRFFSGSYTHLEATTAVTPSVTIGPNSLANNFGFASKSSKLIDDLKFGTLQTNGFTSGLWKKQVQSAITGSGNPTYPRDSVLAYVGRNRSLILAQPFQLGYPLSNGLQEALDILSKPVKDRSRPPDATAAGFGV